MASETYDAIIVGGGAGGLSVGTSLAQAGQKVLIVEKNDRPGGNCSSTMYGDYKFDLAVHQLTGVGDKGQSGAILRDYGVADKLEFKQVDPFLHLVLPNKRFKLPGTWDAFRAELKKEFPDNKDEIDRFLNTIIGMKHDTVIFQRLMYGKSKVLKEIMKKDVTLKKKLTFPWTIIKLLIDGEKSGAELFGRYITNKDLLGILQASWPYLGLPPSTISGVMHAFLVGGQHYEQTYYPVGSSQRIADVLNDAIKENGGEVKLNSEVKKIIVENGTAVGVELPDGSTAKAKLVISNAPAAVTYNKLVDEAVVPNKYKNKLKKMRPSLGPFKVLLGLDYNVAEHGMEDHEYMFYDTLDHEENYQKMSNCEVTMLSAYSASKLDPSLCPPGHSTVVMTIMIDWNSKRDWREHEEAIANEMIDKLSTIVPDIREHIKEKVIFTPQDLKNFSGAQDGGMYGWDCGIDQVLIKRLSQKSPIKNLYHVGHWAEPGPGVTVAIISGWLLGNHLKKKYNMN